MWVPHVQGALRQLVAHAWGAVVGDHLVVSGVQMLLCHAPELGPLASEGLQQSRNAFKGADLVDDDRLTARRGLCARSLPGSQRRVLHV